MRAALLEPATEATSEDEAAQLQGELKAKRKANEEEAKRNAEEEQAEMGAKRALEQKAKLEAALEETRVQTELTKRKADEAHAQVQEAKRKAQDMAQVVEARRKAKADLEAKREADQQAQQKAQLDAKITAEACDEAQAQSEESSHTTTEVAPSFKIETPHFGQEEKQAKGGLVTRRKQEDGIARTESASATPPTPRSAIDIARTESANFVVRLVSADICRKESESVVTPRMDRVKRMTEERKRKAAEAQEEAEARQRAIEEAARFHTEAFRQAIEDESSRVPSLTSTKSVSPSSSPPISARLPRSSESLSKEYAEGASARSVASATTGTEVGSLMSTPHSSHSHTASSEWLLPHSALVPTYYSVKNGEQRPSKIEREVSSSQQKPQEPVPPSKLDLQALGCRVSSGSFVGVEHHSIYTARSNPVQSAALNIMDSQFLWVNRSDADIKREIEALLSNLEHFSHECNELFFASLTEANHYGTMSLEQLHNITQRLVNHLGSRDAPVLERLRMTYRGVVTQRLSKDGITADEFRDYITEVLAHICQELEARQKSLPSCGGNDVYDGLLRKTRSTLDLMKSQQTLHYWSSSEFLAEGDQTEEQHSQPLQLMLSSLRERLISTAAGPSAADSGSKAPSQSSTGSRCLSGQISPKTQEAKETAKESERKAEAAFEQTLQRAWQVLDKDRQLELVAIEDRLREEEARLCVSYRRQRAELRNTSRQEVARLLLPCSPANRLQAAGGQEVPGYGELISSAPSENES